MAADDFYHYQISQITSLREDELVDTLTMIQSSLLYSYDEQRKARRIDPSVKDSIDSVRQLNETLGRETASVYPVNWDVMAPHERLQATDRAMIFVYFEACFYGYLLDKYGKDASNLLRLMQDHSRETVIEAVEHAWLETIKEARLCKFSPQATLDAFVYSRAQEIDSIVEKCRPVFAEWVASLGVGAEG